MCFNSTGHSAWQARQVVQAHISSLVITPIAGVLLELAGRSAVVVGMGNAKGQGLSLTRFFRNRSTLNKTHKEVP